MADAYPKPMRAAQDMLTETLGITDPDEAQQVFLRKASTQDADRQSRYGVAETYYNGDQNVYLTDRAKEFLELNGVHYQENYCEVVVDAMVERLSVVGLTSGDEAFDDWAWTDWWDKNGGDRLQLNVHTEAAKKGDAYLFLEWEPDAGRVCAYVNPPETIIPCYVEGELDYVAKVWNTDEESPTNPTGHKVRRMNLYYPERVEKWFTLARSNDAKAMWARWMDEADKTWPVDWTYDGKPIGIPIYHFANKPRGDRFGRPEHWGTIPQQNRLNKELLDLAAVLDQLGFPQRWATGLSNTSDLKNVPGELWRTDATDGEFGQFDAADPQGLLKAIEATLVRIATRSNTPAFRFTLLGGQLPSGESQKVAEAGLVAKVRNRQTEWGGGTWAEVFRMAGVMTKVYADESNASFATDINTLVTLSINPTWADPETRNEKEHLETLTLMHALGVSKKTLLSMMPGIDPQVEMDQRAEEDDADAERQATAFDMGGGIPTPAREPVPLGPARNGS